MHLSALFTPGTILASMNNLYNFQVFAKREKNVQTCVLIGIIVLMFTMFLIYTNQNSNVSLGSFTSVVNIEPQYVADFSDDRTLMGASHNVFTAKVIDQTTTKKQEGVVETQYKVEIISNIKGSLSGVVTVDQQGGYINGILYTIGETENPLTSNRKAKDYVLRPGSTYLFATRYNPEQNWYTLNPYPTASKLLSNDSSATKEVLNTVVEKDSRVQELKTAYSKEVLLDADIKHSNTLNSYVSTQENSKQNTLSGLQSVTGTQP